MLLVSSARIGDADSGKTSLHLSCSRAFPDIAAVLPCTSSLWDTLQRSQEWRNLRIGNSQRSGSGLINAWLNNSVSIAVALNFPTFTVLHGVFAVHAVVMQCASGRSFFPAPLASCLPAKNYIPTLDPTLYYRTTQACKSV